MAGEWERRSIPALLALEDGTVYRGTSLGCPGETFGEMVFNTGMTGYQEVLTDPSYRGQIVVMTYPEIGIYGVNPEDVESRQTQVAGFVVHRAVREAFNWRANQSFAGYLARAGIVALEGIDTRALTRVLRSRGAMRGAVSTVDLSAESLIDRVRASPGMLGRDLVAEVSPVAPDPGTSLGDGRPRTVLIDAGAKTGIIRNLMQRGIAVTRVPYGASVDSVLDLQPQSVLVSNGPGDPAALGQTIELLRGLLERRIPIGGICLGHQLLALAVGATTYKMRFGHRGANHPVKHLTTGSVIVSTQNHGFAVDPTSLGIGWQPLDEAFVPSLPSVLGGAALHREGVTMAELLPSRSLLGSSPLGFGGVEVTHLSLNDGTLEGLRLLEAPAFSVQYHPEASPGPHDGNSFFDEFLAMTEAARA